MKIKIYAIDTCSNCKAIIDGVTLLGWQMEVLDGNAEENQDILDEFDVDLLPFVRLIDEKGDVAWQMSGDQGVNLRKIVEQYEAQSRTRSSS